ncbi:uncharacterized protein LOC121802433 isoform X1 [Salvia splendens]|uniref:uncharacterized protein LOC121802433 isoform X1 n=1 Tax=Salvia splendens TaxID=180675 RepID=UPI001C256A3E|nr:uncharacterized protein LOC121802433 isoform X1 [Salvia splendens]
MEMKLTAGPKKAALERLRKKIEMSTERIRLAKMKEEQAKKAWEAAAKDVQDEEASKQKLCDDLNNLVQESSNSQLARLEELKRRMESLNPSRSSNTHTPSKYMESGVKLKSAAGSANELLVLTNIAKPSNEPSILVSVPLLASIS